MQIETEVWGEITREQFEAKLIEFTKRLGQPKKVVRLAIELNDYNRQDIDTRIRITDGKPVLMQKLGEWNSQTKTETEFDLPNSPDQVFKAFQIFRNLLNPGNRQLTVIQIENYIFDTPEFEIKLSHLTGKMDAYSFEVELLNSTAEDILVVCERLGLKPNLDEKGEEFWKNYNSRINFDAANITEEELRRIIGKYL